MLNLEDRYDVAIPMKEAHGSMLNTGMAIIRIFFFSRLLLKVRFFKKY